MKTADEVRAAADVAWLRERIGLEGGLSLHLAAKFAPKAVYGVLDRLYGEVVAAAVDTAGLVWAGRARCGRARLGGARLGRRGWAWHGRAGCGRAGEARLGWAGRVGAPLGRQG